MAKRRAHSFPDDVIQRVLLWSARHCCLCGEFVGVGIEVAHLDDTLKKSNLAASRAIDNAIPLCFDCHAAIGHYNDEHPRGKKYGPAELRSRREQVYDRYTSHLVPPLEYNILQVGHVLPSVGFRMTNLSQEHAAKVRIVILFVWRDASGTRGESAVSTEGHYDGRAWWNLNPQRGVDGRFTAPESAIQVPGPLRARVDVTVRDRYDREHSLLPVGFVLSRSPVQEWYFEPSVEALEQDLGSAP